MYITYLKDTSDQSFTAEASALINNILGKFGFPITSILVTNINTDGSPITSEILRIGGVQYAYTHGVDYSTLVPNFTDYEYLLQISNESLRNGVQSAGFSGSGTLSPTRVMWHEMFHSNIAWDGRSDTSINFEEEVVIFAENTIYARAAASLGQSDGSFIRYGHTAVLPAAGAISGVNSFLAYQSVGLGFKDDKTVSFVASQGGNSIIKTYHNFDYQVDNQLYDHYITLEETSNTPYLSFGSSGLSTNSRLGILTGDMMGAGQLGQRISAVETAMASVSSSLGATRTYAVSRVLGLANDAFLDGDAAHNPFYYVGAVQAGSTSPATMLNINDMMSTVSTLIVGGGHGVSIDGIKAGSGNDVVIATGAGSVIQGLAGDDFIVGSSGADHIFGGDDADVIVGSGGGDEIDGGNGYDILTYAAASGAISFNATTGRGTGGQADGDTVSNVERVIGSSSADSFIGAPGVVLDGRNGADHYEAGNQVVHIYDTGTDGQKDVLSFAQRSYGITVNAASKTTLSGDSFEGVEHIVGSSSDDTFIVPAISHDRYTFSGGGGHDIVRFEGSVGIEITGATGVSGSAAGLDFSDIDEIYGTSGSDRFSGGDTRLYGLSGDDTYYGGSGGWFDGGAGSSDVASYARSGPVNLNAAMYGTQNNYGDRLFGVERFVGSSSNDVFSDAQGVTLDGGEGDDSFTMYWGGSAIGGIGDDVFNVMSSYNGSIASISGGVGHDTLIIRDGAFSSFDMASGLYRTYSGSQGYATDIEEVVTPWGSISGTAGSDAIKITSFGGTYGGSGSAFGGAGSDLISSDEGSMADLHGGEDGDTITSLGFDRLYGDGGADYIYGGAKTYTIDGGAGDDWIYTAADGGYLTTVRDGGGTNHIVNSGSSTSTEVHYDFTKSRQDGDGGGLVSVVDQGDFFRVVTDRNGTMVTDYIQGVANIFFDAANGSGSEVFYLRPGINYAAAGLTQRSMASMDTSPDGSASQSSDVEANMDDPISPDAHGRDVFFDGESFFVSGAGDLDAIWEDRNATSYGGRLDTQAFILDAQMTAGSAKAEANGMLYDSGMPSVDAYSYQPWAHLPVHYDLMLA